MDIQRELDLLVDGLDRFGLTGDGRFACLSDRTFFFLFHHANGPANVRVVCPPALMPSTSSVVGENVASLM